MSSGENYKVLTLGTTEFKRACESLAHRVMQSGFEPDCILGIESGGRYVAECIFPALPHLYTRLQRPSTGIKTGAIGSLLRFVLRWLPRRCNEWLRVREARRLSAHRIKLMSDTTQLASEISDRQRRLLLPDMSGYRRVLIVDDAVDSGLTLAAVRDSVMALLPEAEVRSAVITVTEPKPIASPDFTLYHDRTLIRFPWSIDTP